MWILAIVIGIPAVIIIPIFLLKWYNNRLDKEIHALCLKISMEHYTKWEKEERLKHPTWVSNPEL